MNTEKILEIKFYCDDLDKTVTIRGYLKALLQTLWEEEEGFSGKRPFGNSGWKYDVYKALVVNKVIDGKLDSDGYLEYCSDDQADKIIISCIKELK